MNQHFLIKNWCQRYLYIYAIIYPILAYMFSFDKTLGAVLQVYQVSFLFVVFLMYLLFRKPGKSILNFPFFVFAYFLIEAIFFLAVDPPTYGFLTIAGIYAKLLSWLFFFYFFSQASYDYRFLKNLFYCFTIGAMINCSFSFINLFTGNIQHQAYTQEGIVEQNIGSSSALTFTFAFIFFVSLKQFLSHRRYRFIGVIGMSASTACILFSYARALQLGFLFGILYWGFKCFNAKNIKYLGFFVVLGLCAVYYLNTSGSSFLQRWRNVEEDGGSGRNESYPIAYEHLMNPDSISSFMFGHGVWETQNTIERRLGVRLSHLHSDLCDAYYSFGFIGLILIILVYYNFWSYPNRIPPDLMDRYLVRAVFFPLFMLGCFIGEMYLAPYAYYLYITFLFYTIQPKIERS